MPFELKPGKVDACKHLFFYVQPQLYHFNRCHCIWWCCPATVAELWGVCCFWMWSRGRTNLRVCLYVVIHCALIYFLWPWGLYDNRHCFDLFFFLHTQKYQLTFLYMASVPSVVAGVVLNIGAQMPSSPTQQPQNMTAVYTVGGKQGIHCTHSVTENEPTSDLIVTVLKHLCIWSECRKLISNVLKIDSAPNTLFLSLSP